MNASELLVLLAALGLDIDARYAAFTTACDVGRSVVRTRTGRRLVTYDRAEYTFKMRRVTATWQ